MPGQDSGIHYLDDLFQLPPGFRIYSYASPAVAGAAFCLAFDGQGRVHVGTEGRILRLVDRDGDGVAEAAEEVAGDLGKKESPLGLLIVADRFYVSAQGGLFLLGEPDAQGRRPVARRLGETLRSGQHGIHALVRGLDGYLYLAVGNGGGQKARSHITQETSPCLKVEGSTIFRIDPEGRRWEAMATGGRNFYSFAQNELGETFLVDSDGEWDYGLPWYGPVRLCHYVPGGDRGWRDHMGEGCWPVYWPDVVPPLHEVGRGSPTGAVFYEHTQFPQEYRGTFLSGDYMWKRVDNNTHAYHTSGRVYAFRLQPRGPAWEVRKAETLAVRRAGLSDLAKEGSGGPEGFAVLDLAVAPDGSLLVTGHGEGVYRIFYDPEKKGPRPLVPAWPEPAKETEKVLAELLTLPQPEEEWSRAREEVLRARLPDRGVPLLEKAALDRARPLALRLRAVRLLAPSFKDLPPEFLVNDPEPLLRAQAAWMLGLAGGTPAIRGLVPLLEDPDPLVRRRALEGLARQPSGVPAERLIAFLGDENRWIRFALLTVMRRQDPDLWAAKALAHESARVRTGALAALAMGAHTFPRDLIVEAVRRSVVEAKASPEAGFALDVLRAIQLHGESLRDAGGIRAALMDWLNALLDSEDYRLVREASRIAGRFKYGACLSVLIRALERAPDPAQQFHLFKTIGPIEDGWTTELEERLVRWLDRSDTGEINEPRGKGFVWPNFWRELVLNWAKRHRQAVLGHLNLYSLAGAFGGVALEMAAESKQVPEEKLAELRKKREEAIRQRPGAREALVGRVRANEEMKKFLLSAAAKGGDAAKGLEIFRKTGCAACHQAGGGGRVLGPDLPESLKGKPLDYVVESILEPSAKIDPKYRSYVVVTRDDQMLQGFLSEETQDEIVLMDATRPLRIARKSIDRMRASDLSAMPESLANRLTDGELRDLLAFLRP